MTHEEGSRLGELCWYCEGRMPGHYVFSVEFDTWVHLECVKAMLLEPQVRDEALIFAHEFEEELTTK